MQDEILIARIADLEAQLAAGAECLGRERALWMEEIERQTELADIREAQAVIDAACAMADAERAWWDAKREKEETASSDYETANEADAVEALASAVGARAEVDLCKAVDAYRDALKVAAATGSQPAQRKEGP